MNKTSRTLLLTALLTILAITTATATAAQFSSGGTATKGTSELSKGTAARLIFTTTSLPFETTKVQDTWTIQDSKTQAITKIGGHLDQAIFLHALHFTIPETGQPVFVGLNNPITVQFKSGDATISVSKDIEMKIPVSATKTCTVKATAASNPALKSFKDINITGGIDIIINVNNLTATVEPAADCATIGFSNTTTGVLTASSFESGVTQV